MQNLTHCHALFWHEFPLFRMQHNTQKPRANTVKFFYMPLCMEWSLEGQSDLCIAILFPILQCLQFGTADNERDSKNRADGWRERDEASGENKFDCKLNFYWMLVVRQNVRPKKPKSKLKPKTKLKVLLGGLLSICLSIYSYLIFHSQKIPIFWIKDLEQNEMQLQV